MATDIVLSRELKSLQEELSASRREHQAPSADRASTGGEAVARARQLAEAADEQQLRDQLREFVNVITEFVKEAEKNVSAHPTANVVGALIVGILIGRVLGRR